MAAAAQTTQVSNATTGLDVAAVVQALLEGHSEGEGVANFLQEVLHRPDRIAEAGEDLNGGAAALAFLASGLGTGVVQATATVSADVQVEGGDGMPAATTPKVAAVPLSATPTMSVASGTQPVVAEAPVPGAGGPVVASADQVATSVAAEVQIDDVPLEEGYTQPGPVAESSSTARASSSRSMDVAGLATRDAATAMPVLRPGNGANADTAGDTPGNRPGAAVELPAADGVKPSHDAAATGSTSGVGDTSTQPAQGVETSASAALDTADGPQFVNRLADTIESAALRGPRELRITLNPPELGRIEVRITDAANGVRIDLETGTSGARDLLQQHLPALHAALEGRDLRVDRLEVRHSEPVLDQSGAELPDDQQQPQGDQGASSEGSPWSSESSAPIGDSGARPDSPVVSRPSGDVERVTPAGSIDIRA